MYNDVNVKDIKKTNTKLVIMFNLIKIRLGNSLLWHMLITELRIVEEKIYDCECSCIYFKRFLFSLLCMHLLYDSYAWQDIY